MARIEQQPGNVSFVRAIKDYFLGYVDFKGRTTRAGYWWIQLAWVGVGVVLAILLAVSLFVSIFAGIARAGTMDSEMARVSGSVGAVMSMLFAMLPIIVLLGLIGLGFFLPNLAVKVRRLRDAGMTGKGILTQYVVLAVLILFRNAFMASSILSDYGSGYVIGRMFFSLFIFILEITMLVFTVMPTDELTIRSTNALLRFFFRAKEDAEEVPVETDEDDR